MYLSNSVLSLCHWLFSEADRQAHEQRAQDLDKQLHSVIAQGAEQQAHEQNAKHCELEALTAAHECQHRELEGCLADMEHRAIVAGACVCDSMVLAVTDCSLLCNIAQHCLWSTLRVFNIASCVNCVLFSLCAL